MWDVTRWRECLSRACLARASSRQACVPCRHLPGNVRRAITEATASLHAPPPRLVTGTDSTCHVSVADVLESHNAQLQFLKDVDNYRADCDEAPKRSVLQQQQGIAPKGPRFIFDSLHFLFAAATSRTPALASSTLYRPAGDFRLCCREPFCLCCLLFPSISSDPIR